MGTTQYDLNAQRLATLFMCLVAFLFLPSTVNAGELFNHTTSGFKTEIPPNWSINAYLQGLELEQGNALISIEDINISTGETRDILSLFVPNAAGKSIKAPYPGLRTSIRESGYAAEVVILKTPVGFYLVSLEQDKPDPTNLDTFEAVLKSFALLATPPVSNLIDLLPPVSLGSIDLALPAGELTVEPGYLFWKSDAAGILTGEVVKLGKTQTLTSLLDPWERDMLNPETGLTRRVSILELTVEDRPAIQADYTGETMQASVQVSAIDKQNALVLALIARKETFASHRPVLDAVSFSVVPAGDDTFDKTDTAPPAKQRSAYNEVVEAVSEQTTLDRGTINKLYQQQPALFSNIKVTLAEIKSLDQLLTTDPETLVKQLNWAKMASHDDAMRAFDTALRHYKVSIGLLPKGVKTPGRSEKLVQAYIMARDRQNSQPMAYRHALEASGESRRPQDLYAQLLKAKGQTADAVPADMAKYLRGKADIYWQNRLEAEYQHGVLKGAQERLIDQLWAARQADLDRIRDVLE